MEVFRPMKYLEAMIDHIEPGNAGPWAVVTGDRDMIHAFRNCSLGNTDHGKCRFYNGV